MQQDVVDAAGERVGTRPLPELTWAVLEKIPGFAVTAASGLMALGWIIRRRNDVGGMRSPLPMADTKKQTKDEGGER